MEVALQKIFMVMAFTIAWTGYMFWPSPVQGAPALVAPVVGDPADEITEQNTVNNAVKAAVAQHDYAGLSAMANQFRLERSRTASGVWKLSVFHSRIRAELGPRQGQCDDRSEDFFRDWMKQSPNDATPVVARAAVIEAQAWCIRGGGYAPSVSQAALTSFRSRVSDALALLHARKAQASADPHYYAVMVRLAIDTAADKASFRRLLDEATAREPNYHYLYYEAYRYYQPQWFGSSAEIEQLARYAAARATGKDRAGIYARYYWFVLDCKCGDMEQAVDWSAMKQSMRGLMAHTPSAWNAANFARIACTMDDSAETRAWFASVTGDYSVAWPSLSQLNQCQKSAPLERSTERCPQAAREGWSSADVDRYCRGR